MGGDLNKKFCMIYDILSSDTTAMNPQFHIQIPRSGAAKCHVVVSLNLMKNFPFFPAETKTHL